MADFALTLSRLAQFLAERQAANEQQPQTSDLASSLASGGAGMGTDPVYGGLFGAIPQMQQAQQLASQAGAGRGAGGPANLATRGGVTALAPALHSLVMAHRQLDLPVLRNVVSDYRTHAEQQALYDKYLAGTGNLAAPPGHSMHEQGRAVDISSAFLAANPQLKAWLLDHGWANDVGGEPWHYSWQG